MEINKKFSIEIVRSDSNFDKACDSAYAKACIHFGTDEDGYCKFVDDWNRSTDSIMVEFESYNRYTSVVNTEHCYKFTIWASRG